MHSSFQQVRSAVQSSGYYSVEHSLGKGKRRIVCASRRDRQGPGGVSFCVEQRCGRWVLSTWSPLFYVVPARQDVVPVCLDVLRGGGRALARLTPDVIRRYGLEELSEEAFDQWSVGGSANGE